MLQFRQNLPETHCIPKMYLSVFLAFCVAFVAVHATEITTTDSTTDMTMGVTSDLPTTAMTTDEITTDMITKGIPTTTRSTRKMRCQNKTVSFEKHSYFARVRILRVTNQTKEVVENEVGVIISENFVLSHNPCVLLEATNRCNDGPYEYRVDVGPDGRIQYEAELIQHEEFSLNLDHYSTGPLNDIALYKVKSRIEFGIWVQPIGIVGVSEQANPGDTALSCGWVFWSLEANSAIHEVDTTVIDRAECLRVKQAFSDEVASRYRRVHENVQLPPGYLYTRDLGRDRHLGDECREFGDVLLFRGQLAGLNSFWVNEHSAAAGNCFAYVDLAYYRTWISHHTGI